MTMRSHKEDMERRKTIVRPTYINGPKNTQEERKKTKLMW